MIKLPIEKTCPHCQHVNTEAKEVKRYSDSLWFHCMVCGEALMLASLPKEDSK